MEATRTTFIKDFRGRNRYLIPRYGFNNMEKDDELKGVGNSVNYKYRMQDTRLARFFSVDPLAPEYPELTPFQVASNNPVWMREVEGLEGQPTTQQNTVNAPTSGLNAVDNGDRAVQQNITPKDAGDIMAANAQGVKVNTDGSPNELLVYNQDYKKGAVTGNFSLETAGTARATAGVLSQGGAGDNPLNVGNQADAPGTGTMWAVANLAIQTVNANAGALTNLGAAPQAGQVMPSGTTDGNAPSINNSEKPVIRIVLNGLQYDKDGTTTYMKNAIALQTQLSQVLNMRVDIVSENDLEPGSVDVPIGNIAITIGLNFREF